MAVHNETESIDRNKAKVVKPSWVRMKTAEIERLVIELAKQGASPAKIGLVLRDVHGIPTVRLLGKRISAILNNNCVTYTSEREIVTKKTTQLRNHIAKHKHDYSAGRALTKKLWALHRFEKRS